MGDSFSGFDASKYMYDGSSSNYNPANASDSGKKTTIETVDFSGDSNNDGSTSGKNATPTSNENQTLNKDFLDMYFAKYADVNNDDVVDNNDALTMQNALADKSKGYFDLDGDSEFTLKDVTILQKYLNGKEITNSDLNILTNPKIDTVLGSTEKTASANEIKAILSNMTQDEYNQYVKDLKGEYDKQISDLKDYKAQLEALYKKPMDELFHALNPYDQIVGISGGTPVFSSNVNLEEPIPGMTREEVQALYDSMKSEIDAVDAEIARVELEKNNCDYYGLVYTKDYIDYTISIDARDQHNFIEYTSGRESFGSSGSYEAVKFDYDSYVEECKKNGFEAMNPLQYYECYRTVKSTGAKSEKNLSLDDEDVLASIYELKDEVPDYYKTYCYLYDQDPAKAKKYLDDMKNEIFNVHGQYMAADGLGELYVKDGDNDELEAICNTLNITAAGLASGLYKFAEGGVYSVEALATCLGYEGTTQMSAYEYAALYKLYGLMSNEAKEKMGLIKKNPQTGEYENADSESIIDFTVEYSGESLDQIYQFSEGFGTAIPSVALSFIHPMVGTVAMGISSGGNAYHGAMLQGYSSQESVMYGIFSGTANAFIEKTLGGLPGLSNTQVTSLRTYLKATVKEVAADQVVGLMDDLYRANYMGDGFPTTDEGWAEYFEQKKNMAIQSAITSGIMNAPALGTSIYRKRSFKSDATKLGLSDADINDAVSNYRKNNPSLGDISDDEVIIKYGDDILKKYGGGKTSSIDVDTNTPTLKKPTASSFPIDDEIQRTNYALTNPDATLKEIQVAKSYIVDEINNIQPGDTAGSSGRSLNELNNILVQLETREDTVAKATRDKLYSDYKPKKAKEKLVNSGQADEYVLGDGRKAYANDITQQRVKEIGLYDATAQKKIDNQVDGYAKKYGVTPVEMKLTLNNKIGEFISEGEFGIRKGVSTLEKCLDSGSIKNQFETGTTSGAKSPSFRSYIESNLFDVDADTPYSDRPVYGMVFPGLDDPSFESYAKSGPGSFYGSGSDMSDKCIILLNKDAVLDNTSYTLGDSLNYSAYSKGELVESAPASNPKFCGSFDGLVDPSKFSDMNDINKASLPDMFSGGDRYLELQIHGADAHEMNSTNIKEVIFYAEPSKSLQNKLKKANIPWKVI